MAEKLPPLPVPRSTGGRLLYALVAIVLPVPCFLLADGLRPEWQSGRLADYAALLLGTSITFFFAPFLAYAALCLALLLIAPQRFARSLAVRLGIYGGFLLALQYAVLVALSLSEAGPLLPVGAALALCAAPPGLVWIYRQIERRLGEKATRLIVFGLVCASVVLGGLASLLSGGGGLIIALALLVAGLPFWCLDIAAIVSFRLIRDYERQRDLSAWHIVGPLAWLGAYGVAWRMAVARMLEAYAALPTHPPECYIATAAARGHPRLVHSWPAAAQDGRYFRANRQLQRLKCAELALRAAWPAGHRRLRRAYDTLGPRLARRLRCPLLADGAYLLLKPVEWAAWAALRALLPDVGRIANRLYIGRDSARVSWRRKKTCPRSNP